MRGITLAVLLSTVMASGGQATSPPIDAGKIRLSVEDRYALIVGLRSRLRGRFVIGGLRDAAGVCGTTKVCITVEQLQQQTAMNVGLRDARGLTAILNNITVSGNQPTTIVSLQAVGYDRNANVAVQLSILDPASGRWERRVATLGYKAFTPNIYIGQSQTRTVRSLLPG